MTEIVSQDVSQPLRTWSHLVAERRRPTEYEIVSTNMLWSTDDELPWAMGKSIPMSEWYIRYRNNGVLQHANWDGYRDPDKLVYRTYNMLQDGHESYVEALLEDHRRNDHDLSLDKEWVEFLSKSYTPMRYLQHTVQMSAAYLTTMAPASTIENCFIFECADQLRWLNWTAYRTVELSRMFPDLGFSEGERSTWENDPGWQGFRSLMERLLVTWDWGEQFLALHLVARPAIDSALRFLAASAQSVGDTLLAMLLRAQLDDSARTDRFASALVAFVYDDAENGAANRENVVAIVKKWSPAGEDALEAFFRAYGPSNETGHSTGDLRDVLEGYRAQRDALLGDLVAAGEDDS